jgi:hypothetical protein
VVFLLLTLVTRRLRHAQDAVLHSGARCTATAATDQTTLPYPQDYTLTSSSHEFRTSYPRADVDSMHATESRALKLSVIAGQARSREHEPALSAAGWLLLTPPDLLSTSSLFFPSTTIHLKEPVINLNCSGNSRVRVSWIDMSSRAVMKPVLRFSWNRSQAVRILPLLLSPQSPRSRNSGIVIPLMVSLETHDRHKCRLRVLVVTLASILFHFFVSHVCELGYA